MRRLTTTVPTTTFAGREVSCKQLEAVVPAVLLRSRLRGLTTSVISNEAFSRLATECGVPNVDLARKALIDGGVAVDLGTHVHVKPAQLLRQTLQWEAPVRESEEALAAATKTMDAHASALEGALQQLSRRRKAIWGGALAFSGAQLALISRLTYFDLDWDTMEPISYFLGTGTSLLFYTYLLWFRREHSYSDVDHTFVSNRLRSKADVDWRRYDADAASLQDCKHRHECAVQWMRSN